MQIKNTKAAISEIEKEEWRAVPNYKDRYEVSDLGRVRSRDIYLPHFRGGVRLSKSKILKQFIDKDGYCRVVLTKNRSKKVYGVHQLVAMAFLNHKPCGNKFHVDHIKEGDKLDNRLCNLQILSNSQHNLKSKGEFNGVYFHKLTQKWVAKINTNGVLKHIGVFDDKSEAELYYNLAVLSVKNNTEIKVKKRRTSSMYKGVSLDISTGKWRAYFKKQYIGVYETEEEAYLSRKKYINNTIESPNL